MEAAAVQGNKMRRRAGAIGACYGCALDASGAPDRGRAYDRAVDVGRRRMSPWCSSPCSSSATSFRRLSLAAAMADAEAARGERLVLSGSSGTSDTRGTCGTHWCGRARRARRVRAGRAGRRGTSGMCRRRRRSSAYVAGVVTEHGATGVSAPGRVYGGATGVDAAVGSAGRVTDLTTTTTGVATLHESKSRLCGEC
ncbi:hypothetical protein VPH35_049853 [Triticum aestivum]